MTNTTIHRVLEEFGILVLPGIFDPLSARIAERTGFPAGFVSGYSVAATTLGEPDIGLLTQTEMVERARHICRRVKIPIIVDADTGYGDPLNVYRTVEELISAGAAGCFLEDQVWPKRCGHMTGKQIIPREDYLQKIQAAVEARGEHDFFIVARTDAVAVENLDEAIARVTAAREIGADASFVEAPESTEMLAEIGRRSRAPNVANMIEGGLTPVLSKDELLQFGYQLVLYPLSGLFAATRAIENVYETILCEGTSSSGKNQLTSFSKFNELIGIKEKSALAARFASEVSGSKSNSTEI